MRFWDNLTKSIMMANSPIASAELENGRQQRQAAEEQYRKKELERANNPAGKNIVIPADYLRYSKRGLKDGNIVDDYILNKYDRGIPSRSDLQAGTNVIVNPVSGLASGLGRELINDGENILEYIKSSRYRPHRQYNFYYMGPEDMYRGRRYDYIDEPSFDATGMLTGSEEHGVYPDTDNPPIVPEYKQQPEVQQEPTKESENNRRSAYNQARGITSADAYAKQKELRNAGYDITYDGYWGDASAAAWEDYMQTKAANVTPKMETPSLGVSPSVTKPVTTPKSTDPNSPEANRQRFLDKQAAGIAAAKMPSQFANIDIMGTMKAEEARKKAELEALMQKQGAGSELLNTDPHNIQGGYVVPKEAPLDYSKLQTHTTDTNPFGFITEDPLKDASKFYQKGGQVKEKPKMISISGPSYNETMVEGMDSTGTNKYQFREVEQQGDTTKVLYIRDPKTGQMIAVPANSRFNKDFEWMIRNAEPINEYKKGGSLKKCSCGCKTLLKRGKGGKVMESRNCK